MNRRQRRKRPAGFFVLKLLHAHIDVLHGGINRLPFLRLGPNGARRNAPQTVGSSEGARRLIGHRLTDSGSAKTIRALTAAAQATAKAARHKYR